MGRSGRILAAVLVAAGLVAASVAAEAHPAQPKPPKVEFTISGSVAGLYPGGQRPLVLTVRNDTNGVLYVTSISVTSVSVDRSGCPASSVGSPGYQGRLRVAKGGQASVPVTVSMASTAPSACQGATFRLQYAGAGERA